MFLRGSSTQEPLLQRDRCRRPPQRASCQETLHATRLHAPVRDTGAGELRRGDPQNVSSSLWPELWVIGGQVLVKPSLVGAKLEATPIAWRPVRRAAFHGGLTRRGPPLLLSSAASAMPCIISQAGIGRGATLID